MRNQCAYIILHTIAGYFRAKQIKVTQAGVRDGYFYRYVMNRLQQVPAEQTAEAAAAV